MKKTRFILLALAAALILMGAGYAAWTQTFTINSTVSTGELFVQVTNNGITGVVIDGNGDGDYDDTAAEDDIAVTEQNAGDYYLTYPTVTTTAGDTSGDNTTLSKIEYTLDLYPGVQVTSKIKFENLGTIKTKTPSVTATSGNIINEEIWDDLVITVNGGAAIAGSGTTKLTNLANAIADEIGALEPNDTAEVTIVQELPISSGNETENSTELDWEVELTFEQFNVSSES